ncbi:hypothetical protein [Streptomyces xanthophaeus]|uniref:Uncharacterized protein n=1 Tax=Streptomyces xanthophaeus TaxID=67385 RepID=A0A919H2J5_9ACTN|nr:hypothetical protein [Streptomyces xanthophaeus]WCD88164.1 hypothetical protein KPP03845_104569 [Streptomyces xanthophaeus]WST24207.1 hypothetical protein OG264_23530 [Streptomyces xanthophaeus]WST60818.1 hypothetical protein OG605_14915 [Streptomyces xanthophaeus]GHI87907.1 hypothetical protein Sxan_52710 [Streptomyces xanthophaeus]
MSQNFQPPAPSSYTQAPAPAPARSGNVGFGIVAAVVAALVSAAAYGWIMQAADREIGYAAAGVGLLVGLAAGKIGGRNVILPVVAAALSLGAVYLGQMFFIVLALAEYGNVGAGEVFDTVGISGLNDIWKEGTDAMSFLFFALGAFTAFGTAKKVSD